MNSHQQAVVEGERAGQKRAGPFARIKTYARKHPILFAITVAALVLLIYAVFRLYDWGIRRAIWDRADSNLCLSGEKGACWAVIQARWRIILFGLYPFDLHWRSALACVTIAATAILSCFPWFWRFSHLSALWLLGFGGYVLFMMGGVLGLDFVPVAQWGGLALNLFVFSLTTILTMIFSVILVLMRLSIMPLISHPTRMIIDFVRSMPLLVVMFVCAIVLPFGLPDFLVGEKLYRVIFGFALYNACYQAETLRGGIQSLPAGQTEAAKALSLNYWQRISRIILPQAFKITLPSTINQVVIIFLETPLITIIGFFEVLASAAAAFGKLEWSKSWAEVYIFISAIFFVFSFSLSKYGVYLENRLKVSDR